MSLKAQTKGETSSLVVKPLGSASSFIKQTNAPLQRSVVNFTWNIELEKALLRNIKRSERCTKLLFDPQPRRRPCGDLRAEAAADLAILLSAEQPLWILDMEHRGLITKDEQGDVHRTDRWISADYTCPVSTRICAMKRQQAKVEEELKVPAKWKSFDGITDEEDPDNIRQKLRERQPLFFSIRLLENKGRALWAKDDKIPDKTTLSLLRLESSRSLSASTPTTRPGTPLVDSKPRMTDQQITPLIAKAGVSGGSTGAKPFAPVSATATSMLVATIPCPAMTPLKRHSISDRPSSCPGFPFPSVDETSPRKRARASMPVNSSSGVSRRATPVSPSRHAQLGMNPRLDESRSATPLSAITCESPFDANENGPSTPSSSKVRDEPVNAERIGPPAPSSLPKVQHPASMLPRSSTSKLPSSDIGKNNRPINITPKTPATVKQPPLPAPPHRSPPDVRPSISRTTSTILIPRTPLTGNSSFQWRDAEPDPIIWNHKSDLVLLGQLVAKAPVREYLLHRADPVSFRCDSQNEMSYKLERDMYLRIICQDPDSTWVDRAIQEKWARRDGNVTQISTLWRPHTETNIPRRVLFWTERCEKWKSGVSMDVSGINEHEDLLALFRQLADLVSTSKTKDDSPRRHNEMESANSAPAMVSLNTPRPLCPLPTNHTSPPNRHAAGPGNAPPKSTMLLSNSDPHVKPFQKQQAPIPEVPWAVRQLRRARRNEVGREDLSRGLMEEYDAARSDRDRRIILEDRRIQMYIDSLIRLETGRQHTFRHLCVFNADTIPYKWIRDDMRRLLDVMGSIDTTGLKSLSRHKYEMDMTFDITLQLPLYAENYMWYGREVRRVSVIQYLEILDRQLDG